MLYVHEFDNLYGSEILGMSSGGRDPFQGRGRIYSHPGHFLRGVPPPLKIFPSAQILA